MSPLGGLLGVRGSQAIAHTRGFTQSGPKVEAAASLVIKKKKNSVLINCLLCIYIFRVLVNCYLFSFNVKKYGLCAKVIRLID